MSGIVPLPTTRVGDYFVRQRLIEQIQSDQLDLFRLQYQVSTGQRIQLPSEDTPAALRAIDLQRLIDRKSQIEINQQSSQSKLTGAESALSSVSTQLAEIRGDALSVASTTATDQQRQTVIQRIDQVLQTLVDTANSQWQGEYLFAGSQSQVQPYQYNQSFVEYLGNEVNLRSHVDVQRLFDTNVLGTEVFGGISSALQGSADLDPQLTRNTLLTSLNGGKGVSSGAAVSVSIDSGGITSTNVVDLSGATTVGDVARLIEANAPGGATITAEVTGAGLKLTTDTGTIRIGEVAEGRSAHELGIYTGSSGAATSVIQGLDVDPVVTKTTRLDDLLGTKAQGRIVSSGANNDILIAAAQNGESFNDVTVEFVAGGTAGSEAVTYDAGSKTLTVEVQAGFSTAKQVATAITAEGTFTAQADYRDATLVAQAGSNPVEVSNFGLVTSGGGGEVLDTTSGLILTNGGDAVTLDISNASTVEDMLNLINGAGLGLQAEINNAGNGINVRSRLSGADLTIGENGGTTASQLGIRSYTEVTKLADFNRGVGVPTSDTTDDLAIVARDGTELSVDLSDARTVQDVLDAINNHPDNNVGDTAVLARLATNGNGIELVDMSTNPVPGQTLTVRAVEGSHAAHYLGFVADGETETASTTVDASGNDVLTSEDRHTLEADSVFNSLIRLRTALENGDVPEIGRCLDRMDVDVDRVLQARADIGSRLENLDVIQTLLEDENVELQTSLSENLDVDLVEAISNLTARQYAMQASLQSAASIMQYSLLDFI